MMLFIVALALSLPLLATGAFHQHAHVGLHDRALVTEVITVTEVVTKTIIFDPASIISSSSPTPLPEGSVTKTVEIEVPSATPSDSSNSSTNGNPFKELATEPHSVIVQNSCAYDVYVSSVGHSSCGPGVDCKLVPAGTSHTENMRACSKGGISLKVSKTSQMLSPMQFEYTVWANQEVVSYDISYLDCMKNYNGEQDLSACAGHDAGIQAIGGGDCKDFYCHANKWCAVHAYVIPEFGYQDGAPVGGCAPQEGIAFELCAGNR